MPNVAIVKGENPVETTLNALRLIEVDVRRVLVDSGKKSILVKPNYINLKHPSTGITTDSRVIEGVVKFLKEGKISIATFTSAATFNNFMSIMEDDALGLRLMVRRFRGELVGFGGRGEKFVA